MSKVISFLVIVMCLAATANSQNPEVVSVSPTQSQLNVSLATIISVVFDQAMEESSINDTSFLVYGSHGNWY